MLVTPDERVVSRYMEECRRVTVGLISGNWLHHPNQLSPVMKKKERHQHQKPTNNCSTVYLLILSSITTDFSYIAQTDWNLLTSSSTSAPSTDPL